jgi:ribosomal protein S18 acetylase RimI-like enzyme
MVPLYHDPHFTFRFADDGLIRRFHLEGIEVGPRVSVFSIDPDTGERLNLLATAAVGEGGWVDLREPIVVRAGEVFIVVPEHEGRSVMAEPFEVVAEDACSADAARLTADLSAELARRYDHADDGSGHFRPEDVAVPRSVFLVGRLGGRPVACGAVRPLEGDVGEVKRMYVEPAARGRQLGKRLLAALEEAARSMGYVAVRLETAHRQPEAIRLYESAGYRRIEPFGIYAGSQRSICFEKRLT